MVVSPRNDLKVFTDITTTEKKLYNKTLSLVGDDDVVRGVLRSFRSRDFPGKLALRELLYPMKDFEGFTDPTMGSSEPERGSENSTLTRATAKH